MTKNSLHCHFIWICCIWITPSIQPLSDYENSTHIELHTPSSWQIGCQRFLVQKYLFEEKDHSTVTVLWTLKVSFHCFWLIKSFHTQDWQLLSRLSVTALRSVSYKTCKIWKDLLQIVKKKKERERSISKTPWVIRLFTHQKLNYVAYTRMTFHEYRTSKLPHTLEGDEPHNCQICSTHVWLRKVLQTIWQNSPPAVGEFANRTKAGAERTEGQEKPGLAPRSER